MANRHERRHGTPAKKSSWTKWLWIGLTVLALIGIVYFVMNKGTGVDYTQYNYTDDKFAASNASVVIEEFSDFQCPYCQQLSPTMRAVREGYVDDVRIVYKEFPLRTVHEAECAREQNRFWAYHDVLFESQKIDKGSLKKHAQGLGLDMDAWNSCIDSGKAKAKISADLLEGQQRGVRGTPALFINGEQFNGRTLAEFESAIRAAKK
jgi:protein-disulfide isomerase